MAKDLQVRATVPEGVIDTMCLHADAAVWFFLHGKAYACMHAVLALSTSQVAVV